MQYNNDTVRLSTLSTDLITATTDTKLKSLTINNENYTGSITYDELVGASSVENYIGVIMPDQSQSSYSQMETIYLDDSYSLVVFKAPDANVSQSGTNASIYRTSGATNLFVQLVYKNNGLYKVGEPLKLSTPLDYLKKGVTSNIYGVNAVIIDPTTNTFILYERTNQNSKCVIASYDTTSLKITQKHEWNIGYTGSIAILPTSTANKFLLLSSQGSANLMSQVCTYDGVSTVTKGVATLQSSGFFFSSATGVLLTAVKASLSADNYVAAGRGSSGYIMLAHLSFNTTTDALTVVKSTQLTPYTTNNSNYPIELVSLSTGSDFHYKYVSIMGATGAGYNCYGECSDINTAPSQAQMPSYITAYYAYACSLHKLSSTVALFIGNALNTGINTYQPYGGVFYSNKGSSTLTAISNLPNSDNRYWYSNVSIYTLGDGKVHIGTPMSNTATSSSCLFATNTSGTYTVAGGRATYSSTNMPPTIGVKDRRLYANMGEYEAVTDVFTSSVFIYKQGVLVNTISFEVDSVKVAKLLLTTDGKLIVLFTGGQSLQNMTSTLTYGIYTLSALATDKTVTSLSTVAFTSGNHRVASSYDAVISADGLKLYIASLLTDGTSTVFYLSWLSISGTTLTNPTFISSTSTSGVIGSQIMTFVGIDTTNNLPICHVLMNGAYYYWNGSTWTATTIPSIGNNDVTAFDHTNNAMLLSYAKNSPIYKLVSASSKQVIANNSGINLLPIRKQPVSNVFYANVVNGALTVFDSTLTASIFNTAAEKLLKSGFAFWLNNKAYILDYIGNTGDTVKLNGRIVSPNGNSVSLFKDLTLLPTESKTSTDERLMSTGEKVVITSNYRYLPLVRFEAITA